MAAKPNDRMPASGSNETAVDEDSDITDQQMESLCDLMFDSDDDMLILTDET